MHIRKERRRIRFNLRNLEPHPGVQTRRSINDTRLERTLETSNTDSLLRGTLIGRVGESDTWWAGGAARGFVDVRGGVGGGHVGCVAEADEADVVADEVLFGVEAEVVEAAGALGKM